MTPQEIAEQLNKEWLGGNYQVTQMPGKAAPSTQKFYSNHKGYDFGTPAGTLIKAPRDLQIISSGMDNTGYGNRVGVYDPSNDRTYYLSHLKEILASNGTIKAGEPIATTGGVPGQYGSGNTTGAHLDMEVYQGNKPMSFSQQVQSYSQPNKQMRYNNTESIMNIIKNKYGEKNIGAVSSDLNRLKDYAGKGYKIVKISI